MEFKLVWLLISAIISGFVAALTWIYRSIAGRVDKLQSESNTKPTFSQVNDTINEKLKDKLAVHISQYTSLSNRVDELKVQNDRLLTLVISIKNDKD